ncbi:cell division protein ZipA [Utexia brackfieldae]|uniref:cell division protein ZipA n=1 Tax=Utexia brackfieldae TaxID=3074108 RepID=UPI00370DAE9B
MDNLRLILIVVATLALVALLIHGFWINKKERSTIFNKKQQHTANQKMSWENKLVRDDDDISEVRIVSSSNNHEKIEPTMQLDESHGDITREDNDIHSPVQCDLFSEINEKTDIVDKTENNESATRIETYSYQDNITAVQEDKEVEVKPVASVTTAEKTDNATVSSKQNDVLVLHVTGLNGEMLNGENLLHSILQAGFLFGEMQIFHRHVDPAGNGPVLFSLANMVKPGYLNPESMSSLVTPGISVFMMIPSFGDNQQNFKIMLQSVQRIADDVNGVVLDDERHMLTPQKITSYKDRIKKVTGK